MEMDRPGHHGSQRDDGRSGDHQTGCVHGGGSGQLKRLHGNVQHQCTGGQGASGCDSDGRDPDLRAAERDADECDADAECNL